MASAQFTPAARRYVIRTLAFMTAYVAVMTFAMTDAWDAATPAAGWVLAAAASAPIVGQIWATLGLMAESDEFVRELTARRFIAATGATMALATFWGFGESFADAPHVSAWMVYPIFWACFGVISPFIRSTR
ncbi:hypothetical protein [Brevundimonas sp.]|jgi:hypothetical protein|uniref:hypothetical protein n=1 Tax=Brevundimonas sp. TaxID=1871086 RepID=UPI002E166519|nr:hypothetical protein [Brevundimonas sp.]